MKLLFCVHCHDIVRLFSDRRSCKCGKSWGQYLADNSTTVQTDRSLSIAFANPDFTAAVEAFVKDRGANRSGFSPVLCFRAWMNPDSEADVRYVTEEQGTAESSDKQAGA
jgi:hypothetical protein